MSIVARTTRFASKSINKKLESTENDGMHVRAEFRKDDNGLEPPAEPPAEPPQTARMAGAFRLDSRKYAFAVSLSAFACGMVAFRGVSFNDGARFLSTVFAIYCTGNVSQKFLSTQTR